MKSSRKPFHPRFYFPLALMAFLFVLPILPRNPFYEDLILMIFFWGTLAAAWNLVGGFAGQISLGHTAFFGIGAYTSTLLWLKFGLSPWLGMFAGAGLAILIAIGIGVPCFRLRSHFFALATIAFAEVLRYVASYWRGLTQGGVGLLIPFKPGMENFMFRSKIPYAYIALGLMLLIILVSYIIRNSRFGFYLISLREDQDAAETLGVNTSRCKLIALIISVFFTAVAGTFYAQYLLFIDPDTVFSLPLSIELALLAIIGGLGTVIGPVIGAFILIPLDVLLRGYLGGISAGLNFIVYGIVLVVAVIYFPRGVAGWLKTWYEPFLRRLPGAKQALATEVTGPSPALTTETSDPQDPDPEDEEVKSPLFQVHSLTKYFGGLAAVKDVSFEIKKGEILGLIGPNGAGKTTIFNLITGFLSPDSGKIEFRGEEITGLKPPHKVCLNHIGRTFQLVKPFNNMTVLENVMVGAFSRVRRASEARKEATKVLDFIGLLRQRDSLASSLTIADRKRLELGKALATKPEILLLDEVVAGLNPRETEEIISIVRAISRQGITLFIIEHVMKAIMTLSHRIIVLHHGEKIAEGTPAEISRNKRVVDAYLGEEYLA
ncbi:MAG: ATP-binding cassette domain-containing protein [Proteobacteria bacterium]|nr:ATP-binding cassette domain-containing protein [Pseudomonadota bacterium]